MTTEATTSTELRKTGISVIGDVRWGTHFCYFYETKQDLLETQLLYFKAGLESKELCLWVVSQALSVEEAKHALAQAVPDLERHLAEGALEIHRHDEWYLRDGRWDPQRVLQSWREKLNQTLTNGYAGLRAAGDGGWIQNDDWMAFREYEKQVNAMIADQRSIILCTYPLTTSPGDQVFDVANIHHMAMARRNGRWEMVETPELKQAKAEIKRLNQELEQRVIERTSELAKTNEELRREITERRRVEEELRESAADLAEAQRAAKIGNWIFKLRTNKVTWSEELYRIFEIEKPDFDGRYDSFVSHIHPDDRPRVLRTNAQTRIEGSPFDIEYRIIIPNGPVRIIREIGYATQDEAGNVIQLFGTAQDITERRLAEEALRESETRFRQMAENISAVFWLSNPEATLLHYVSPAYEKIWGRSCDSLYAEPNSWMDSVHPDDRERLTEDERLQSVGGRHDHTYRIVRPDGSLRWIRGRAFPVRDEAGKLIRVAGIAEDITERKEAEERLRRSEEKFKALFGIAPVGISVLDGQRNVVDANPALEQITRLSKEELLNGTYRRRTYLKADGTPRSANEMASARAITENRPINDVETGIVTENGELIWTQVSVAPLALPDTSAVVITQDITERKQAEQALRESDERFRELAGSIDEVFWLIDVRRTAILYVSPAYEKLWGRSCDSLYASPRSWIESIHPEDKERVVQVLADHELETAPDMVYRIIRPDGSTRWVHARGFPVHDANGAVVRVAGIAEDITERKRAAKALEEANLRLRILSRRLFEVQEEERCHLARELHDEIGQALTAAKINLQSVTGNGDGANFARLQETTAILDRLLGQVRQISLDLRPSMLDDLGLVPALRSLLDQQGRRASVAVRFSAENIPEKLDPEIQTTCFRIAQETITNALRHAGATQLDVDLRCENGNLRLLMLDNGTGFDVESAQAQTVGLGLIGIQERAALLGGRAKITSSPNKGTTIEVSLPLRFRLERQDRHMGQ